MENFKIGDKIEHTLFPPGMFTMAVLETRECETDFARPEPHLSYRVVDPEGNEDWLCGYEARRA